MLKDRFHRSPSLPEFVEAADANHDLWAAMAARAQAPLDLVERVASVPGTWHLLVLLEDWCGDAVSTIPQVAALAEAAPNLDLRVLERDANLDLMDEHLTHGSRSIPVVLILNAEYEEVAWWGPRPAPLQRWVRSDGQKLSKEDRYREVRRWYARDRGRSTLDEIVEALESAQAMSRAA